MKLIQLFETFLCGFLVLGLSSDNHLQQLSPASAIIAEMWAPLLPTFVVDGEVIIPTWAEEYLVNGDYSISPEEFYQDYQDDIEVEIQPKPEETGTKLDYNYGDPVPNSPPVSDDFFTNTVVIGDSRAKGLMAFGNMPAEDFTAEALSIYNLWTKAYTTRYGTMPVLDALTYHQFDKIYIHLGINSIGYPNRDQFYSLYSDFIDAIRALQPNVDIYVHNILPVNETILHKNGSNYYINNTTIKEFNLIIAELAREKELYYLDIYNYFLDDSGQLPYAASTDGLHFGGEYAKLWTNFLFTHTI